MGVGSNGTRGAETYKYFISTTDLHKTLSTHEVSVESTANGHRMSHSQNESFICRFVSFRKWHSRNSGFQNFSGKNAPETPPPWHFSASPTWNVFLRPCRLTRKSGILLWLTPDDFTRQLETSDIWLTVSFPDPQWQHSVSIKLDKANYQGNFYIFVENFRFKKRKSL